jgi:UDP-N-acetylmuramyl pentapeptide phosphotransferase/UDP-N-acetylglucosamine-1-phosphate transferase
MSLLALAAVAAGAFVVGCAGTWALIPLLRRRAVLDRPNARSSHVAPTPRGGGIAVIGTIVLCWIGLYGFGVLPSAYLVIVVGAIALAGVSWLDDLRGLSPALRLLTQIAAVAAGKMVLPHDAVFQGWLPSGLDAVAAALLWVWFVNLFNFMDGIDGIAGGEAAAIGLGLVLFAATGVGAAPGVALTAAAIAGAALGFLVWNWAPARIFMGDVGSIPLGYVLGFLLLQIAAHGWWRAALILPSYFLADATLTLLRRLARGERIWQAHREHFYQRAVRAGLSHSAVARRVITADAVLIGCAWAAENGAGIAALGIAALTVAALLWALGRGTR